MFCFKKKFGQNFLVNKFIINKIVDSVDQFDSLIEIGPGNGSLTRELLKRGKQVTAIDIDIDCINELVSIDSHLLTLIHFDILKYELPYVALIGNLPYNISSKIIEKIVFSCVPFAVFMVQKEVGDILTGKDFSKLTVFAQSRYSIYKLIDVKPGNFIPKPKVDSQVVIFKKHELYENLDIFKLKEVLLKLFMFRRKKLRFLAKIDERLYKKALFFNWNMDFRIDDLKKEQIFELVLSF